MPNLTKTQVRYKKSKNTQAQHSMKCERSLKKLKNNYKVDTPIAKHVALF